MKAIILAAGYGRRMKPLTDNNHKTLLPIAGIPIINRIIDALVECGIRDIVVVTGYLRNKLVTHLNQAYSHLSLTYIHNEKYAKTNNIFSLALAFESIEIDSDIILIESDLIFDPSVLRKLINNKHKNVALVDSYGAGMDGTVVTVESNIVTNVIPPHLQNENFNFSDKFKTLNIYKFSQEFAATSFKKLLTYYARVIDDNCYYELILGILIFMQREVIHAEILDGEKWAEVDDPNDLGLAAFVFDKQQQFETLSTAFGGYWNYDVLDFCFIRNMYFPTGAMISELKNNMDVLFYNYGSKQSIINQKMAYALLCKKENLQALNGAAQIYPILGTLFKNKTILIPSPTFGEYERVFNKIIRYEEEDLINFEQITNKSQVADIILFVNPNNPTGSVVSSQHIYDYAQQNPQKLIIVDESFIEFSGQVSMVNLLEDVALNNILIIKSLSKSWGIPGLRLGYCYTYNQKILNQIKQATPIWNMNSAAEFFLEIILKHRADLQKSIDQTIKDRTAFKSKLSKLDIVEKVYPSGANFLLVKLKGEQKNAEKTARILLQEHKIFIKVLDNKFQEGAFIRLAVRLPQENNLLVKHLRKISQVKIPQNLLQYSLR